MTTPSHSSPLWDVAVIGGGPAGTAAATLLSKAGHKCLLLDAHHFPRYHIGESLIPQTYDYFQALDLLPKLKRAGFPEKHSVRFVSRDGKHSAPFYFSEAFSRDKARTWQVERSEFDQIMLNHAQENGVTLWENAHVDQVLMDGEQAAGLIATRNSEHQVRVRSRVIIDASGRSCVLGRQLGLKRELPDLRKSSIWGYFEGAERQPGIDAGETTIFLQPHGGWFWYIPLADDIVSVGVVGDTDLLLQNSPHYEMAYQQAVDRCPSLKRRLDHACMKGRIRGMSQLAYVNRQTSGNGWVMLGDARAFLDPIYSSGVFLALASAQMAAQRIDHGLRTGDLSQSNLGAFEPTLSAGVENIRRLIHAFYDPEFSFSGFLRHFPEQRGALIDCLTGNVFQDMGDFSRALASMSPPPDPMSLQP